MDDNKKSYRERSSFGIWLVGATMGYGHLRAVYPLIHLSFDEVISVGEDKDTSLSERRLWRRILYMYEMLSRAQGIPWIGKYVFGILDFFLQIPSFYPQRDLSHSTFQVRLLASGIRKGLCSGMIDKIKEKDIPLVSAFYAPAIAADMHGFRKIYCIICDTDLNRVWVADDPWESRIEYFVPTGRAARRLKAYGVPENRIHLTGFPLPMEVLGSRNLEVLKKDLGQRLYYLDPEQRFWKLHKKNVAYFLGSENCGFTNERKLTLTYAVGGAGAQKETGKKIAESFRKKLIAGEMNLYLVAGTREEVNDYFLDVKEEVCSTHIHVIYDKTFAGYYKKFNEIVRHTDILWTKPSELSFYTALGIPVVMSPPIGAQERANKKWLKEIQAGIKQESPEFADQWLFDMLRKGRLAEAAWSGFLKARKKGVYNITDVLLKGEVRRDDELIR
ncbi:MAG: hypothetical protein EA361_15765 [Bacteroidetes bacterium]|nr:MAG: hypothetical protein EA361_15765 [Bacteroidota bacterium]